MGLFKVLKKTDTASEGSGGDAGRLVYASARALEQALDGTGDSFRRYFFALYHCTPDEDAGINKLRQLLRADNPSDAVEVGDYFVLWGASAFEALSWYYSALAEANTLSDEFRDYARNRLDEITRVHVSSQKLTPPIALSAYSTRWRTRFHADGGQCSSVMADSVPR